MKFLIIVFLVVFSINAHARRTETPISSEHSVEFSTDHVTTSKHKPESNVPQDPFPWIVLITLFGLVIFKIIERSLDGLRKTMNDYHETVTITLGAKPIP
ncbi:MAG: hypothetical protein AAGF85_11990 [Bacteroidota bacterium]